MSTRHGERRGTTAALAVVAVLALVAMAWTTALPHAAAHGGDLRIDVGTDGAGGVDAVVVWARDGHPVEEAVDITVEAVSDDGSQVGPVRLLSASEGVGWYRSGPGLLDEGHWTLTVRTTEPARHALTTEIDVVALPTPSAAQAVATGAETDADAASASAGAASPGVLPWAWPAVGAAVLGAAALIVVRRRRNSA